MSKISQKDKACIQNILESVDKIQKYSQKFNDADSFYADEMSFDASMMNFIIIGEMAGKISGEFIASSEKEISWIKVKNFRNLIAHNYFGIDAEEVWQIIHGSLADLDKVLKTYL